MIKNWVTKIWRMLYLLDFLNLHILFCSIEVWELEGMIVSLMFSYVLYSKSLLTLQRSNNPGEAFWPLAPFLSTAVCTISSHNTANVFFSPTSQLLPLKALMLLPHGFKNMAKSSLCTNSDSAWNFGQLILFFPNFLWWIWTLGAFYACYVTSQSNYKLYKVAFIPFLLRNP